MRLLKMLSTILFSDEALEGLIAGLVTSAILLLGYTVFGPTP